MSRRASKAIRTVSAIVGASAGGRPPASLGCKNSVWMRSMTAPMHNEQIQSQWARVRGKLRAEMGETAYRNWLKKLTFLQIRGQEVELAVHTRFVRDWIVSHYQ